MPTVVGVRGVFLCAVVLLMLAFIATKPGLGDTITFQDIGDTVTVDTTSTRVSGISCEMEECFVNLTCACPLS
jgi:hypothetical protein